MGGFDFLVEGFQPFELRREAAFRGRVDYEDDFVLEGREGVWLAFFCAGRILVRRGAILKKKEEVYDVLSRGLKS